MFWMCQHAAAFNHNKSEWEKLCKALHLAKPCLWLCILYELTHSPPKSLCTVQFNSQIKNSSCLITYFPVLTWISIVLHGSQFIKSQPSLKVVNIIKQTASVKGVTPCNLSDFLYPFTEPVSFCMHVRCRLISRSNSITASFILFPTNPVSGLLRGIKINTFKGHWKCSAVGNGGHVLEVWDGINQAFVVVFFCLFCFFILDPMSRQCCKLICIPRAIHHTKSQDMRNAKCTQSPWRSSCGLICNLGCCLVKTR